MSTILLQIDERRRPPQPAAPQGWALWALGFRPFYLAASLFAALSVPLWALQFAGLLDHAWLRGPLWHAHEMVFGFALAVIVGFLLTAGQNWAGQPTPKGPALAALLLLWLAARVLALTPWGWAALLANVAFAWLAAFGLARALVRAGNRRNYFFVGLLVLMGAASAAVHLVQLGVLPSGAGIDGMATRLGLDIVLFVMAVMAGRVVPMFTNNGVPGTQARRDERLEKLALGAVLALIVADALALQGPWLAALLLLAGGAHLARQWLWQPWRTRHNPLVWILHAAYAWLPLHLLLRAAAEIGWLALPSLATHALTAGAIGALTLGMMTRTARGHTGRPLRADRWDIAMYITVLLAGLVRVAVPLLMPAWLLAAVGASAVLWSVAFALYAWHYGPWLLRPRTDGKPG
ncbi:MAG: NnrS family protein [Leptothrix sp. (in: b-proteobacteria)]